MARDVNGTYTRVSNSFSDPIAGTTIDTSDAIAFFDDVEAEITDSLSRSGKGGMSADLDMNNNDINEIKTAVFQGSTSGNTTVQATAIAGTTTLTLPAATDTLVGKATTDTLTNKTFDTAGTGNVFKVNGVTITAMRELLAAARTYYVRADGSDSNTGLVDSAGGAFLTIQKAIDVAAALDTSIYNVTITVGAGTFTGANTLKRPVGGGTVIINGAGATTIISTTSNHAFTGTNCGKYEINNVKIQTTTSGSGLFLSGNLTDVTCTGIEIGACASAQIRATQGAALRMFAYTISGGSIIHYQVEYQAMVTCVSVTVTLTGTPAFSTQFAQVSKLALLDVEGVTWSGSATGTRYTVTTNGVLNTATGSVTTLPGNAAAGTPTASGGQYT